MLRNLIEINLDTLSEKTLSYCEKDFNNSIEKHKKFLQENLENQESYNAKFSEILQNMEIFESENNEDEKKKKRKISRMKIIQIKMNQMNLQNPKRIVRTIV